MIPMIRWLLIALVSTTAAAETQFSDLEPLNYWRNPYYSSKGYFLGFVLDFYRDGLLIWSYEGQLMVGFGSSRDELVDPHCLEDQNKILQSMQNPVKKQEATEEARKRCVTLTNPWRFSTMDRSKLEQFLQIQNAKFTPVVVHYVTPFISIQHAITETKNFVLGIYPVNPHLKMPEDSFNLSGWSAPTINVEKGYVDGRVVRASLDHWMRKSFEVTIQEGPYGNAFRRMSVDNQQMMDYILKAMLTGRMLRITFVRLIGLENQLLKIAKDYDTPYRITGVEVRDQPVTTPGNP